MYGYQFVKDNCPQNIDRYGIRVENGVSEAPMFFCKVMYGGQRYLGKYRLGGQYGTCNIAVGLTEESKPKDFEILESEC